MKKRDRYAGNILEVQARTRQEVVDAAQRHAFLAGAASHMMEIDGGWITNREGVRQRLTIFVRADAVGDEHPYVPDENLECKTCGGGACHYLHPGGTDG